MLISASLTMLYGLSNIQEGYKKNAYRVFRDFKEALKIGHWKISTMEEKITIKEDYFKETFMIGTWRSFMTYDSITFKQSYQNSVNL